MIAYRKRSTHFRDWIEVRHLAEKAQPLVPKDRQEFFQANILTQADLHLHFNRMVMNLMEMQKASEKSAKIAKL